MIKDSQRVLITFHNGDSTIKLFKDVMIRFTLETAPYIRWWKKELHEKGKVDTSFITYSLI